MASIFEWVYKNKEFFVKSSVLLAILHASFLITDMQLVEIERGKRTKNTFRFPEELVIEKDINDLNEIRQYFDQMDKKTLVFFDLDDTVFEPEGELGSTLWSYHLTDKLKNETGMNLMEAFGNIFPLWVLVQRYINLKTIDNSDQIIKAIQQKGVNVLGLTNRPICMVEKTIEALEKLGIKFSESYSNEIQLGRIDI